MSSLARSISCRFGRRGLFEQLIAVLVVVYGRLLVARSDCGRRRAADRLHLLAGRVLLHRLPMERGEDCTGGPTRCVIAAPLVVVPMLATVATSGIKHLDRRVARHRVGLGALLAQESLTTTGAAIVLLYRFCG